MNPNQIDLKELEICICPGCGTSQNDCIEWVKAREQRQKNEPDDGSMRLISGGCCPDCNHKNPLSINEVKQFILSKIKNLEKKRVRMSFSIEMNRPQEFEGMVSDKEGQYVKWSDILKEFMEEK